MDKDTRKNIYRVVIITGYIFVAEFALMILFDKVFKVGLVSGSVLDSIFLTILILPILYLLVLKPSAREISRQKEITKMLKESEEKYRSLTETSPDCIKLFDKDGKLLFINKGGLKEHGLKDLEEAKKWNLLEGIIEEDRPKFKEAFKEALEGKEATIYIRHTHEGSNREECKETIIPVRDVSGKVAYVFGVSRDISDIRKLERMKDLINQAIVHDLKNPLAILLSSIECLEGQLKAALKDDHKKVFIASKICITEINNMTSNILDVSKIEEGKLRLKYEEVDFNIFLSEIVANMQVTASQNQNRIVADFLPDSLKLQVDKDIIKRVLYNIIGNAVKFSPPETEIAIIAKHIKEDNNLLVGIKNQGLGVPDKYKDKIFEKFVQAQDNSLIRKAGKGLGLTFCKMAVEMHGGKIWVESEANKGTTFYFTIPVK